MSALSALAAELREGDTPISRHVVDPAGEVAFQLPEAYAPVVEAIYEGYLLHYGQPRLLAGHDDDLALLAGDYLYALGLERLAALGDTATVKLLADLISRCAQLHTEGKGNEASALWDEVVLKISS